MILLFSAMVLLLALVTPAFSSTLSTPESVNNIGNEGDGMSLSGYVSSKYSFRSASSGNKFYSDQDLYEHIRFDLTSPASGRYELHFFGVARQDMDGGRNTGDFSPLERSADARDSGDSSIIYDAHIVINKLLNNKITRLRIGRQAGTRDDMILFDGVSADLALTPMAALTIYAGSSVHFDELEYAMWDDTLGGIGLDIYVTPDTMVGIDYLNVRDKRKMFQYNDTDDDMYSLKLWHRFNQYKRGGLSYRYFNGEPRDIKIRASSVFPKSDLELSAVYFRQYNREAEVSQEVSSYFDVIGETTEYDSYNIKVRKFFGEHYALDMGYYSRALIGNTVESPLNRDYSRAYVAFDMMDIYIKGLTVSTVFEQWESADNSSQSAGLDATYIYKNKSRRVEMSAGTFYSLYKYDYYTMLGERDDVQTYYVSAKLPLAWNFSAEGKYEYENGTDDFQTLSGGVSYDF